MGRGAQTRIIAIALAVAGAVMLGRGEAFWLCVPGALLGCRLCRTPAGSVLATATIVGAAAAPLLVLSVGSGPQPALAVLVPGFSALVLLVTRRSFERERDQLLSASLTDPLTGLANRRSLLARADYEIARHNRDDRMFALVMVDLDGFKGLNDRFGHAAGDELLCDVGAALNHAVRAQDTVARLGGDEFCVLAPETDVEGAVPLAARITEAVGRASVGVETLRASVGTAVFPDDGRSVARLMHVADQRLFDAKRVRTERIRRRAA